MLLLCAIAPCRAQPDPYLLQRVTQEVLDTVDRLPRYLCTQTIDRSQFEPIPGTAKDDCEPSREKQLRLTTSDRLRLDVAMSAGHEMYSWVGESHFDNRSLFELAPRGALSTGAFASFLEVVFRDDRAGFSYRGESKEHGRQVAEFEFHVPASSSHYAFHGPGARVITGYSGTILVDPQTAELVRLTVESEGLPSETGSCEVHTSLAYHRARLNGADFLLPSLVDLRIVNRDGVESQNTTTYSGCHEFVGESAVSFDAPGDAAVPGSGAPGSENGLPASRPFTIQTEAVDAANAAAGDKIEATLTAPLRDLEGRTIAPAGAKVVARILEMRRFYAPIQLARMAFKLESVQIGGVARPLKALVQGSQQFQPLLHGVARRYDSVTPDNRDPATAIYEIARPDRNLIPKFDSKWSIPGK